MKALVTVMPLAGHVNPITGLVAELIARGHSVTVYTGSRYCSRFAELGATAMRWSAATDFDEEDVAATFPAAGRPGRRGMAAMTKGAVFFDTAPGQVHDLGQELDRSPTDVIIGDIMSVGAGCISELRHLPWATVNVLPFNSLGKDLAPLAFGLAPARGRLGRIRDVILWQAFGAATLPVKRAYNQARIQVGLPQDPQMYGVGLVSPWSPSYRLSLARATGSRAPETDALPGPAGPKRREVRQQCFSSAHPLVIVTQGTHHVELTDLIQPAIEGLADLDVSVIATTGRRGKTDVGIEVTQNARIVDFLDFPSVLPETSVFVTNGGWGGVLASLAAGFPWSWLGATSTSQRSPPGSPGQVPPSICGPAGRRRRRWPPRPKKSSAIRPTRNGLGRSAPSLPLLVAPIGPLTCWKTWWRRRPLYGAKRLAATLREFWPLKEVVRYRGEAAAQPTRIKLLIRSRKGSTANQQKLAGRPTCLERGECVTELFGGQGVVHDRWPVGPGSQDRCLARGCLTNLRRLAPA